MPCNIYAQTLSIIQPSATRYDKIFLLTSSLKHCVIKNSILSDREAVQSDRDPAARDDHFRWLSRRVWTIVHVSITEARLFEPIQTVFKVLFGRIELVWLFLCLGW